MAQAAQATRPFSDLLYYSRLFPAEKPPAMPDCLRLVALLISVLIVDGAVLARAESSASLPTDNPAARYRLDWTDELRWSNSVSIADFAGETLEDRLRAAQAALVRQGGGVVYFPPGVYQFRDHIRIQRGVILRGANPAGSNDARREDYRLPTRFEFPQYRPVLNGSGTPIETAFKGIYLENPATAANCGIVNVEINRGHIDFGEAGDHQCGGNRIVLGCILRNAAVADPRIPNADVGQHAWQRFTSRHHAAIAVKTRENALVANNRLPESGDDNFAMNGYRLRGRGRMTTELDGVVFDYDNRPGIYVNSYSLGGAGGNPPDGTPESHPHGFRQGIVIRGNYVYCTGRCAIAFSGDGTICSDNVIRFARDIWRPTATGDSVTSGSSTNDNRAVQMRGWRWNVTENDYEVYRNWAADRKYRINDGEGLMHEDHANSTVRDSVLRGNKGNSYISIYKTAGIDGLRVEDNEIRTAGGIAAIYVVANRNSGPSPCRSVTIAGNTTAGSGIEIAGSPAENNVVRDNRHEGDGGKLVNRAAAELSGNEGYNVAQ